VRNSNRSLFDDQPFQKVSVNPTAKSEPHAGFGPQPRSKEGKAISKRGNERVSVVRGTLSVSF